MSGVYVVVGQDGQLNKKLSAFSFSTLDALKATMPDITIKEFPAEIENPAYDFMLASDDDLYGYVKFLPLLN